MAIHDQVQAIQIGGYGTNGTCLADEFTRPFVEEI
jgi:hypothetical protein